MAQMLEELHACERALEGLSRRRAELPGRIADLEGKAQAARDLVQAQREALDEAGKHHREREGALLDTEAQRDKFKGQTALVKTNEEYTALLREIDHAGERISLIEEEILVTMEQIEDASASLESSEREQARIAADLDGQAAQLREELRQVETDLAARSTELDGRVADLETDVRQHFERARRARGTGTARLNGRVCSACHRDVPFEDINRVLRGEVLPCQSCRRLLVIDPGH